MASVRKKTQGTARPVRLFVSYCHEDTTFHDRLIVTLTQLENEGVLSHWSDHQILPGDDWKKEILKELKSAHIILFLVSPHFLISKFINCVELKEALDRHKYGKAILIPVLIRIIPDVNQTKFAHLQWIPNNTKGSLKPVKKWSDKDEAYAAIANAITKAAQKLRGTSRPTLPTDRASPPRGSGRNAG